ncbi:putative Cyclochlorotine biosynthesis protein O [Seiridium unicorne]|uniref:Cyclochlorotine biosynthesis protein O n=1 Tax=Seiridium unicorne TaxID=138068 RepID=A0ABR2V5A3_9PEZI
MAAGNSSYRYDLLEGHAMVAHNSENRKTRRFLYTFLTISSLVNILFIAKWFASISEETHLPNLSRASYAGLLNNIPVPFQWASEYSDIDNPRLDELWQFDGMFEYGMIALMDTEIESMSLLPSEQGFPWDPETPHLHQHIFLPRLDTSEDPPLRT